MGPKMGTGQRSLRQFTSHKMTVAYAESAVGFIAEFRTLSSQFKTLSASSEAKSVPSLGR